MVLLGCLGLGALPGTGAPVAWAAKKPARKIVKRGKWVRPVPRGKRHAIAALPPLRDAAAGATSVMPTTTAPPPASQPAAVGHPATAAGKAAPAPTPGAASPAPRKKKGPPTDDELMQDAQAAYVRGERAKAIDLALVVAEKGNDQAPGAWKFIGLAACSVRSYRLATRAYQNVKSPGDQKSITDACKYNGLSYKGDGFVGE